MTLVGFLFQSDSMSPDDSPYPLRACYSIQTLGASKTVPTQGYFPINSYPFTPSFEILGSFREFDDIVFTNTCPTSCIYNVSRPQTDYKASRAM